VLHRDLRAQRPEPWTPYAAPERPEVHVATADVGVDEAVERIVAALRSARP